MGNKTILIFLLAFNIHGFCQKRELFRCKKDGYYCVCDSTDKVIASDQWEHMSHFKHGYARVRNKTRSAYIDSTGKYESDCPFEDMGRFHYGYTWACDKLNNLFVINSKCEVKFSVPHVEGERSAAFFDSTIVIYAMKENGKDYGVVDYNFNVIIPFDYDGMLKSSSARYYFVSKPPKNDEYKSLWGIYDIVEHKEVVPCSYIGSFGGQLGNSSKESTYSLDVDKGLFKEMEKYNITLPTIDEISNRINEIYN